MSKEVNRKPEKRGNENMVADEIYKETISFPFIKTIFVVIMFFAVFFLYLLLYQVLIEPIGFRPAPNWFYLLMVFWFAVASFVIINFDKLTVKISSDSIMVGFGMFKQVIPWSNISDCYEDDVSAVMRYGGWGIRIGRVKGRWRLVYNVINVPRIVLRLKKGRFREFVFSTENPVQVTMIIEQQIGKKIGENLCDGHIKRYSRL